MPEGSKLPLPQVLGSRQATKHGVFAGAHFGDPQRLRARGRTLAPVAVARAPRRHFGASDAAAVPSQLAKIPGAEGVR